MNAFFNAIARVKSLNMDVELPDAIIAAMNQRVEASRSKRKPA